MFKKAVEVKGLQRLSGADRKKLRRSIKERFKSASDADIDLILPPKVEVTVAKLPNRVHVYSVEGGLPVLFDIDGRGRDIYPTVFALWSVPELLPAFLLKGAEVSRYILGGADLMFPGIDIPSDGLPQFLSGQPWAVKVPGNAAPIAVGCTMMSADEANKAGLRGKALRVFHHYRDLLWESVDGYLVPNAGFMEDIVLEDPTLSLTCQPPDASSNSGDLNKIIEIDGHGGSHMVESSSEQGVTASGHAENMGCNFTEISSVLSTLTVDDAASSSMQEEHDDEMDKHTMTTEEVDALLDRCLLQALHTSVKEKDLPMPGSTLWSAHILPCRPVGVTVDIKKSSHKKLSKWLQLKSSTGLISAKEDKHKKEMILLSVNHTHPDYKSFKPEKRQQVNIEESSERKASDQQAKVQQLEVVEVYKPSTHVLPIFASLGADSGRYYSSSEANDIVYAYVEKENLVKPTNKAVVVLDAALCDALFKGTVKKGSTYPTEIHKKDLGATFQGRMQVHHVVSRGTESSVKKGSVKPVQIMTERRQGNKKVTRLSGLETFLVDEESLATELQKKFACSTTVSELPGKKGQLEVVVQGGVIDNLAKYLLDHYGIPKRYIEVLDKTKK